MWSARFSNGVQGVWRFPPKSVKYLEKVELKDNQQSSLSVIPPGSDWIKRGFSHNSPWRNSPHRHFYLCLCVTVCSAVEAWNRSYTLRVEEHFSRMRDRRCQLCLACKPRMLIGLFKGCPSLATKKGKHFIFKLFLDQYIMCLGETYCTFITCTTWDSVTSCIETLHSFFFVCSWLHEAWLICLILSSFAIISEAWWIYDCQATYIIEQILAETAARLAAISLRTQAKGAHTQTPLTSGSAQLNTGWHDVRGNALTAGSMIQLMKWWHYIFIYKSLGFKARGVTSCFCQGSLRSIHFVWST